MFQPICINVRTHFLDNEIYSIILESLCNAADHGCSDGQSKERTHPDQKLFLSEAFFLSGKFIENSSEDVRIE
ncbi:hypothetical protein D3C85_1527990 [compost metagenome]